MSSAKRKRKGLILNLIREREIATQSELVEMLLEKGVDATQASVSRDLEELEVRKDGGVYRVPSAEEAPTASAAREPWLKTPILGMVRSGQTLLVLHTPPGLAPSVGLILDRGGIEGVAGTIAGDDTLFVAITRASRMVPVEKKIRELLFSKK
jgi:transcriptional regulator of arginine metabolism